MISLFLFVIMAISCLALSVSVSDLTIGSDTSLRSNPDAESTTDQNVYEQAPTFMITNTLNQPVDITDVTLPFADPKYDLSIPGITFPIHLDAANSTGIKTIQITVKGKIPKDLPSYFENNPTQLKVNLGNIVIKSAVNGVSQPDYPPIPLYVQAKNFLRIGRIYIQVNDGAKKSFQSGDTLKGLKPGDKLIISVRADNKYTDNDPENLDFSNADISIESDSELGIDDSDTVDVSAGTTEEVKFQEVDLADDVKQGKYDMTVTLSGEDDNGALQGEQIKMALRVEKLNDEIAITDYTSDTELTCDQTSFEIGFTLMNIGSSDQSAAAFRIMSPQFAYEKRQTDIELNEGDEESYKFTIPVPSDITPGVKTINIISYYDTTQESHTEYVTVTVPNCQATPTPTPTPTPKKEPVQQPTAEEQPVEVQPGQGSQDNVVIAGEGVTQTTEPQFMGSTTYLVVLVLAIVITLACIIILVVVLLKVNKPKI